MFFGPKMMAGKSFETVVTLYTTSATLPPPAGALFADIECISGGGGGGASVGGQGGNYAFATISLIGVTSLGIFPATAGLSNSDGSPTTVLANGSTVCLATGAFAGGTANTSPGIGSVFRYGGVGSTVGADKEGGGAAGPVSAGGDATNNGDGTSSPGASGGAPAGAGGQLYGGGGKGGGAAEGGRAGCVRITYRG